MWPTGRNALMLGQKRNLISTIQVTWLLVSHGRFMLHSVKGKHFKFKLKNFEWCPLPKFCVLLTALTAWRPPPKVTVLRRHLTHLTLKCIYFEIDICFEMGITQRKTQKHKLDNGSKINRGQNQQIGIRLVPPQTSFKDKRLQQFQSIWWMQQGQLMA